MPAIKVNGDLEAALRQLRKEVEKEGILREAQRKAVYVSAGEQRRREERRSTLRCLRRWRKAEMKAESKE